MRYHKAELWYMLRFGKFNTVKNLVTSTKYPVHKCSCSAEKIKHLNTNSTCNLARQFFYFQQIIVIYIYLNSKFTKLINILSIQLKCRGANNFFLNTCINSVFIQVSEGTDLQWFSILVHTESPYTVKLQSNSGPFSHARIYILELFWHYCDVFV